MRRIVAAILVWVIVVGGTWLYLRLHDDRAQARLGSVPETEVVEGYRVELVTTFSAEPDPFALQLDDAAAPTALLVRLNGAEVLRRADDVAAGESIAMDPLGPVLAGNNELYVEASPPGDVAGLSHALRVRVYHGYRTIADTTLWNEPGASLSGGVSFEAAALLESTDGH